MLNKSIIMGRLTADPELRNTPSGTAVISFCVAVDRSFKKGEERQTDFIDCVAWSSTAEFITKYFRKGSMIIVIGRLQSRMWKDKSENNRKSIELTADEVLFGESKRDNSEQDNNVFPFTGPAADKSNKSGGINALPGFNIGGSEFNELTDDDEVPF